MQRKKYCDILFCLGLYLDSKVTIQHNMCLTSVKKNTVYAKSHTEQVYTITLPIDTLEELIVNSLQKLEWLWQFREMALPPISVNASSAIIQTHNTTTESNENSIELTLPDNYEARLAMS